MSCAERCGQKCVEPDAGQAGTKAQSPGPSRCGRAAPRVRRTRQSLAVVARGPRTSSALRSSRRCPCAAWALALAVRGPSRGVGRHHAARMIRLCRSPQVSNPAGESNPRCPTGTIGLRCRWEGPEPSSFARRADALSTARPVPLWSWCNRRSLGGEAGADSEGDRCARRSLRLRVPSLTRSAAASQRLCRAPGRGRSDPELPLVDHLPIRIRIRPSPHAYLGWAGTLYSKRWPGFGVPTGRSGRDARHTGLSRECWAPLASSPLLCSPTGIPLTPLTP